MQNIREHTYYNQTELENSSNTLDYTHAILAVMVDMIDQTLSYSQVSNHFWNLRQMALKNGVNYDQANKDAIGMLRELNTPPYEKPTRDID